MQFPRGDTGYLHHPPAQSSPTSRHDAEPVSTGETQPVQRAPQERSEEMPRSRPESGVALTRQSRTCVGLMAGKVQRPEMGRGKVGSQSWQTAVKRVPRDDTASEQQCWAGTPLHSRTELLRMQTVPSEGSIRSQEAEHLGSRRPKFERPLTAHSVRQNLSFVTVKPWEEGVDSAWKEPGRY